MDFRGDGLPLTTQGVETVLAELAVGPPELWAVLRVETRGWGFLVDRRPQILFERHLFHRLTGGAHRAQAPDISNPRSGGYVGGGGEYDRLATALAFDRPAALASCSWGIGQVLGANAAVAGFADVEAMVTAMTATEDAQLGAMARFIVSEKLDRPLQRHDWARFARRYNGPQFMKLRYDERLAEAHANLVANGLPSLALRAVQLRLLYEGFQPGPVDGLMGNRTRSALRQFQTREGLPATGEPDAATEAALAALGRV
jgi:hypothetical protein